jgi:hypothetical protein
MASAGSRTPASIVGCMATSGKAGPSPAWFILPVILLLAAALLVGLGFSSLVGFLRSDIRAYQPGSSVSVTEDGLTLYAPEGAREAVINLSCSARRGDQAVPLSSNGSGGTFSNEQGRFVNIASTPAGMPAGRYAITCVDRTAAGSDVPLYLGPRFDFGAFGRGIVFGVILPLFLGLCAIALFAILGILRYRSGKRSTSDAGQASAPR